MATDPERRPTAAASPPAENGPAADPSPAVERVLTIRNRRGLHARASAKFVQTAEAFQAEITVARDDMRVGGQSIMGLMMLAAAQGATITVAAAGPDAEAALEAVEALIEGRFGEDS